MEISEEDYLAHYGVLRRSGRYPWGSGGEDTNTRNRHLLDYIADMRRQGLSEKTIADGLGLESTTQLRAIKSIALAQVKQASIIQAQRLKATGMSNVAIGAEMGLNESSVRALLAPSMRDKADVLQTTASMLRNQVDEKRMVDIGTGVATTLGMTETKLATSVAILKEEGYNVYQIQVPQIGTGNKTTVRVLAHPDITKSEAIRGRDNIRQISEYSEDGGRSYLGLQPPLSVDSKRVGIVYKEDGGDAQDGVIYVRRNVEDVSLGSARYAQVRVMVDNTHYLKGMAVYSDNMPDGVDLLFHTNKERTGNKLDAMKKLKEDEDNPFGAIVRQIHKKDAAGNDIKGSVSSAMNIVNEEGDWDRWSRSLSSQMLSKQSIALAKGQLDMTLERRQNQLDTIMSMSNPMVRKKLLEAYADSTDSAAVHLKAAALPRQANRVILPIKSLKDNEIYAPGFRDGERVVLVRYPHGGPFEIPELTVNSRNREGRSIIGAQSRDAVGINPHVAARLSGADFDGDAVLVIPNNRGHVKTAPALERLKGFDPQMYKIPDGSPIKKISPQRKQTEMGKVTNLIADMTIKGASSAELAQAVRHSMVVIDSEKHGLDFKQSELDHGIRHLKEKYQYRDGKTGASTLITQAGRAKRIDEVRLRSARAGGPVDPVTGAKVFVPTGKQILDRKTGKPKNKQIVVPELSVTRDAHTLSSGTPMEKLYADHSNTLKALADKARLESLRTQMTPYSPSAKNVYSSQVERLNSALDEAIRNRPRERQAQIIANATINAKTQANPNMEDETKKKIRYQALAEARVRTGAQKHQIKISPDEWEAIQAGAISSNKLSQILDNADQEVLRKLALPREKLLMTDVKKNRALQMLANGYEQADVADQLGVSLSTLKESIYSTGAKKGS